MGSRKEGKNGRQMAKMTSGRAQVVSRRQKAAKAPDNVGTHRRDAEEKKEA